MASAYDQFFGTQGVVCTVKDVAAPRFIKAFAKHMKRQGKFEVPKWADVVKTGPSKDLPPYDEDWLYIRTASIARQIYNRGGSGVGSFRAIYGSQKRRGTLTNKSMLSGGKIIRYCMQQLEEMGIVEVDEDKGGRRLTPEGQREMDTVAVQVAEMEEEEDDE